MTQKPSGQAVAADTVLVVYVPEVDAERVKEALFSAGAGRIGAYEHCCWQCLGTGQFRPLAGSAPSIGQHDVLEQVAELRIEMVLPEACLPAVIAALRASHPYEEPAFHYWPVNRMAL